MPVKLGSKLPAESAEARIEIVPLIDIMFFLLASFMLVSLSLVNLRSVKVNLPTASTATAEKTPGDNLLDVSVDKAGAIYLDRVPVSGSRPTTDLSAARRGKPLLRVLISGDADARHGDVLRALDLVRAAGIDQVAFETNPSFHASKGNQP